MPYDGRPVMAEIARDQSDARLRQISFCLPNRLGALFRATQNLEREHIRVRGLNILDSADHAVIRMVVDRTHDAIKALTAAGYPVFETEILGVALPAAEEGGIRKVLSALLGAEVNILYSYALTVQVTGQPVLALKVDDAGMAARVVRGAGLSLVDHDELGRQEGA